MKSFLLLVAAIVISGSLSGQSSIQGKVSSVKTGQPVSDVQVRLLKINALQITNASGNFVFNKLEPGVYSLHFSAIGYKDTSLHIQLSENQSLTIEVKLQEAYHRLGEVLVSVNRSPKRLEDVPARIDVLDAERVASYPATNVDNFLQAIPNVYVNRSSGIFSKNSSLTMRGLDGTARVLVLLDGVPLNFSAGGGINWHMIESAELEKIEIMKGPASALYGNNAMGGVINLITKKPANRITGMATLFGGTYNTLGGELNFGNNFSRDDKGFYWTGNLFYRQGDGYIIVPETERDSNDVALQLKEFNASVKAGYHIDKNQFIETEFRFYTDKRNDGIKIYEPDGSFLTYTTSQYRIAYQGKLGAMEVFANAFYHLQDYGEHSERLNETGDSYKLYIRNQQSTEYGIWLNMSKKWDKRNELSFGIDLKSGDLFAEDIYLSSTDYFKRGGKIDFYALFVQDEMRFLGGKLLFSLGLRLDFAQFKNGYLKVTEPTPVTAFENQFSENFHETNWKNLSPKIALKYKISPKISAYTSFSTGFMPPKIDDMVSSRKVNTGFKIANPDLKPESLNNLELGLDMVPNEKLLLNLSAYYSTGSDFQYFVGTGDTVDVDRPVVKRENISRARIYGFESSLTYQAFDNLKFTANYTFNHSSIKEFNLENYYGTDLRGLLIAETPPHQAYAGAFYTTKLIDIYTGLNYIGEMWQDEQNTVRLEPYTTLDLRILKKIKKFTFSLDIQNMMNKKYMDKKGGLAPGRFMLLKIACQIKK
jgi:iron complex outermembrane recepter protein